MSKDTPLETAREAYNVVFIYDIPMPTTLTVAATSADHAEDLAKKELQHHRNVEILDVYRVKDAPEIEDMLAQANFDRPIPKAKKSEIN